MNNTPPIGSVAAVVANAAVIEVIGNDDKLIVRETVTSQTVYGLVKSFDGDELLLQASSVSTGFHVNISISAEDITSWQAMSNG